MPAFGKQSLAESRMKAKGGILARIGRGIRNLANRFRINPAEGGIF
jgi:hypothetical protein